MREDRHSLPAYFLSRVLILQILLVTLVATAISKRPGKVVMKIELAIALRQKIAELEEAASYLKATIDATTDPIKRSKYFARRQQLDQQAHLFKVYLREVGVPIIAPAEAVEQKAA